MIWIGVLLAAVQERDPGLTPPAVGYLVRHQGSDGSWGDRPAGCDCRRPPPPRGTIEQWISGLSDDDLEARVAAQDRLKEWGRSALPALEAAAARGDAEVRGRAHDAAARISCTAEKVDRTRATGLALIVILEAGPVLSPRSFPDVRSTPALWNGLRWLVARQRTDGAFEPENGVSNAIACCAVVEAYALSRLWLLEDPARRGVAGVERWAARTDEELFWKAMVLGHAGARGESGGERPYQLEEIFKTLGARETILAQAGAVIAAAWHRTLRARRIEARVFEVPLVSAPPDQVYVADLATFHSAVHRSEAYRCWRARLTRRLEGSQAMSGCERGSWEGEGFTGRVAATAYGALLGRRFHGLCCNNVYGK